MNEVVFCCYTTTGQIPNLLVLCNMYSGKAKYTDFVDLFIFHLKIALQRKSVHCVFGLFSTF
ncbi:uncharacterized protein BYT42DRAFT_552270 [Radiomyces spectabilis]|uniref:uncharacterized protein n=1 Tax=Radiomyces spectabilis TaxID=64574 RepID=UPI00221FD1F1|nr:uncharacterized protein BYT42DRAFT_552270 [Radiomyces spectabilis]KAI8393799.1 hypothetical protein BYT42DRAFT_552270 [Radiomyces spectabilis]